MLRAVSLLLSTVRTVTRSRADLLIEIAALRQQLEVYSRASPRPRLERRDRLFWIWLCRRWARWRTALVIVKPETVLGWHRAGYRAYWRRKSKGKPGRPPIPAEHRDFIRQISADHPEWGEDRIALELKLKLGVEHSPSTIRRYMVERATPPRSSTWKKFLASHADQIWSIDFTTLPPWNYAVSYVLVVMALGTREIIHVGVTRNPTMDWVKQQLREATAWGEAPRFLMHDNDAIFGQYGSNRPLADATTGRRFRCALDAWLEGVLGIRGVPIPYGAPNAAAHIERFMGTFKREALDHFIFFSEAQLLQTARSFVSYYNEARPHQGIDGIPACGPGKDPPRDTEAGDDERRLVARPVLGGLHHDYRLAA